MEVTLSRRVFQKHLEPARPLRRCANVDQDYPEEPRWNPDNVTCEQAMIQTENNQKNIDVEQFYKILQLHKQKKGRISYTRDFLIGLASSPVAKRKPEFLPEHPVVLPEARSWVPEAK